MKALQCITPRPVEDAPLLLREISIPTLEAGEILLRVRTCGICHTDLHVVEGDLPTRKLPVTPGHQIVGVVEHVGAEVVSLKVGDRVGIPWLYSTCGSCESCKRGEENLCDNVRFTGYDVDGGYAEYVVALADYAYRLPDAFSDEAVAPLLCAGIIGYRALRLSNVHPGGRLGLFGFGASAHVTIQVARHWGCEVYSFSRSADHRRLAEELGAVWTGNSEEKPTRLLDSAISFAPVGDIVPLALQNLRKGGTLALAGIHMTPIPQLDYSLLYQERVVRSVANSTRQDAIQFLKIAAEIPVKTETEVFPFLEANRALQLLKAGKIRGAGVLTVG